MAGGEGGEALGVEPGDQVGDGVAGASACGVGSLLIVVPSATARSIVARET